MRLTLVQFFQPSFSGQGREHSRSTVARVHFSFEQDKSDVRIYGANSFHPEKHLQGTESRSYLHLCKQRWTHMSPCPSSHPWWEGLAFSMALKLRDRQTRCNWDWESHKALCWRNSEGLREERNISKASTAVLRASEGLLEEGGLNFPYEILVGRTRLSHKLNSWIIFFVCALAMLNGLWFYMHAVPFVAILSLDNLGSSFGKQLKLPQSKGSSLNPPDQVSLNDIIWSRIFVVVVEVVSPYPCPLPTQCW